MDLATLAKRLNYDAIHVQYTKCKDEARHGQALQDFKTIILVNKKSGDNSPTF